MAPATISSTLASLAPAGTLFSRFLQRPQIGGQEPGAHAASVAPDVSSCNGCSGPIDGCVPCETSARSLLVAMQALATARCTIPAREETIDDRPAAVGRIAAIACFGPRKTPSTFTSITRSIPPRPLLDGDLLDHNAGIFEHAHSCAHALLLRLLPVANPAARHVR